MVWGFMGCHEYFLVFCCTAMACMVSLCHAICILLYGFAYGLVKESELLLLLHLFCYCITGASRIATLKHKQKEAVLDWTLAYSVCMGKTTAQRQDF